MKTALVVTTIQSPNAVMQALSEACRQQGAGFFVVGDRKSPPVFELAGAQYFSLDQQHQTFGEFSRQLPVGHYVRKNLGYLAALDAGAEWIVETDDDNYPLTDFLKVPSALTVRRLRSQAPWLNVYDHFGPSQLIWPRGFPLESLRPGVPAAVDSHTETEQRPLLVQGLADDNPDVDAVYRLTQPLPVTFDAKATAATLEPGCWCPFNSQNTWWHRSLAPLMYLPAYCSFRMTDIWRSFVAQRCLWALGSRVVFTAPTVRQERNEHNLLRDFSDEIPGYLKNEVIRTVLDGCALSGSPAADLLVCYEQLVARDIFPKEELALVQAWVQALEQRG